MIGLGEAPAAAPPMLQLVGSPHLHPAHEHSRDQQRAARLWPDSPRNQHEWLRAVRTVRRTTHGWLLERQVPRSPQP